MIEAIVIVVFGTSLLAVAGVMIGLLSVLIGFGRAAAIVLLGGKP